MRIHRPDEQHETVRLTVTSDGEFQGRERGSSVSVIIVSTDEVGAGPRLHRHPYDETFVIRRGAAEFTIGDETRIGWAGEILVVPPMCPHKFVKIGDDRLEMVDIHANDEFITEWLE